MDAEVVPALVTSAAGIGALLWGALLALSSFREYRRSRTVTVEILGSLKLDAGPSYRFRIIRPESPPADGRDWIASTPARFEGRILRVGETADVDYDPGYPGFIYPPGRYPVCRLWPVASIGVLVGAALIAVGGGLFG
jgi:hypothetical protein